MTNRKPKLMPIDNWVDRQIQQSIQQGDFDNLPGKGKPLDFEAQADPMWWVKQKLKDENLSMPLPPPLELRRAVAAELPKIMALPTVEAVHNAVAALNARIRKVNAYQTSGPSSDVVPFDVDQVLQRWREKHR